MGPLEIQDYARQLFEAQGDKAIAAAANKAVAFERKGDRPEAAVWRQIEAALKLTRGAHES